MKEVLDHFDNESALDDAISKLATAFQDISFVEELKDHVFNKAVNSKLGSEALENLLLPHEAITEERITTRLQGFIGLLESLRDTLYPDALFLVSIARSSTDGYTQVQMVDHLQERVMDAIHSCLCSCDASPRTPDDCGGAECRIKITFDYAEWEGSTFYD